MKTIYYIILLLLLINLPVAAQVSVQFVPEIYGRNINGLFNCQLINAGGKRQATMVITVNERNAGLVARINVPEFTIGPGASPLPATAARTASVQVADTRLGQLTRQANLFPEGDYDYCFELTFINSDLAPQEQCFSYALAPFADLSLIDPYDQDSICNKRPLLSWQPLIPGVPGAFYQLVLVEMKSGQNATEAINYNLPVVNQLNITAPVLPYPPIAKELEAGKKYAWQVSAYKDQTVLNRSEVWEFSVNCRDTVKKAVNDESYRDVEDLSRGNFYVATGHIKITLVNSYVPQNLRYEIRQADDNSKRLKRLPKVTLERGKNFIDIDISDNDSFKDGKYYIMNIALPDGTGKSLRFVYHSLK